MGAEWSVEDMPEDYKQGIEEATVGRTNTKPVNFKTFIMSLIDEVIASGSKKRSQVNWNLIHDFTNSFNAGRGPDCRKYSVMPVVLPSPPPWHIPGTFWRCSGSSPLTVLYLPECTRSFSDACEVLPFCRAANANLVSFDFPELTCFAEQTSEFSKGSKEVNAAEHPQATQYSPAMLPKELMILIDDAVKWVLECTDSSKYASHSKELYIFIYIRHSYYPTCSHHS
jgi:hypothetical protein